MGSTRSVLKHEKIRKIKGLRPVREAVALLRNACVIRRTQARTETNAAAGFPGVAPQKAIRARFAAPL